MGGGHQARNVTCGSRGASDPTHTHSESGFVLKVPIGWGWQEPVWAAQELWAGLCGGRPCWGGTSDEAPGSQPRATPSHLLQDPGTLEPACPLASERFQGAETLSVSFSAHSAGCNMRFFSRLLTPRVPIPHPSPSTSAASSIGGWGAGTAGELEGGPGVGQGHQGHPELVQRKHPGGASLRPSGGWSGDQLPLPVRPELAPDFLCLPTQLGGCSG